MIGEFKTFLARGSVLDMAIGVIVGSAFGRIVTSLVNDILIPPIGVALNGVDFTNLFIPLRAGRFPSVAAAKAAGTATINYGVFLNHVIDFLIIAFVLFLVVRTVNRLHHAPVSTPTTKSCPFCISAIPVQATRCPQCTSDLSPEPSPTKSRPSPSPSAAMN